MRCPPIDILVGFVYIEGAGVTPRPSVCYQFSNLRIAAVIRPEIVPARIVSAKTCNLLGCAVGLCRRRFFLPISTTPFLLNCLYYNAAAFWMCGFFVNCRLIFSTLFINKE